MKKSFLILASLFVSSFALASPISNAKAAEFGLHRVERLVLQKKAEAGFLAHLQGMTIEPLVHQNNTDAAFKVVAYQFAAADNSRRKIEMALSEAGKPITVEVKDGGEPPVGFPVWPSANGLTLCEGAIHYILENVSSNSKLQVYFDKLSQFSISAGKNSQGQDVAVVDVVAGAADPVLKIFVKFDGTLDSVSFVQP